MNITKIYPLLILGATAAVLQACDPGLPSDSATGDFSPSGFAEPLSGSDYEALSDAEKYRVANKLLGTMYKGIPVDEFFDLSAGLSNPRINPGYENYIQQVREAINQDLSNEQVRNVQTLINGLDENNNPDPDRAKYRFSDSERPKEEPLALIQEYPLSRHSFVAWMAHFLANTIMFSPAEEMESTNLQDVQNTYKRLVNGLTERNSVRQIIRSHLPSVQRWRVARTPENTGIEGFELYLGLFETKEDSVRVGTACKDLYLTDEDDGYELASTNFGNTDPQVILQEDTNGDGVHDSGGFFITTCDDFYNVLSGHPLVMPRACEVIANYLMAERTLDDRLAMCESIVNSGAVTFEDLFKGILFSREYLLNTERPKGFEETFMSTMNTLRWDPRNNSGEVDEQVWRNMATNTFRRLYMRNMGWDTMTLKIGRTPNVPLDALSFANYHKALREQLLINDGSYEGRISNIDGVDVVIDGLFYTADAEMNQIVKPDIAALTPTDFLHFLFLSVLQRQAGGTEITELLTVLQNSGHLENDNGQLTVREFRQDDIARIVFDYASRLPELYYFKQI
ncbi:MAG TPA: hypothetical protein VF268_00965 [Gammaproteobacteria bacterium]